METFLGFLNNSMVMFVVIQAWGLLLRFYPPLAVVKRWLIPVMQALLAFLIKVIGPTDANAGGVDSLAVVVAGTPPSFYTMAVAAVLQSGFCSLFYDKFLKAPLVARLDAPKKRSHH